MPDQSIEIRISARNLSDAEFAKARAAVAGLSGDVKKSSTETEGLGVSLKTIGQAAAVVGTAIVGLAGTIVALGVRGAAVNDVTAAFNRLNEQAGQDGPRALAALREGVGGLLTDYDLMKGANAALSAGFKLNEADAKTMGEAAWVLADITGGDLKQSYDTILDAMTTGEVKGLEKLGVDVQSKDAIKSLKDAMALEGDQMSSNQQKVEARKSAMEALRRVVEANGAQELDFGEKLERAKNDLVNFTDRLGGAIAASPVLGTAMDALGEIMTSAFRGKDALVQTLVSWINKAVIFVVEGAAGMVSAFGLVRFALMSVKIAGTEWGSALITASKGVLDGLIAYAEYVSKFPGMGYMKEGISQAKQWSENMGANIRDLTNIANTDRSYRDEALAADAKKAASLGGLADKMREQALLGVTVNETVKKATTNTVAHAQAVDDLTKKHAEFQAKQRALNAEILTAIQNGADITTILDKYGKAAVEAGRDARLWGDDTAGAVQYVVDAFKSAEIGKALVDLTAANKKAGEDIVKNAVETQRGVNAAWLDGATRNGQIVVQAYEDQEKAEGDSLEQRLRLVSKEYEEKRRGLDTNAANYTQALGIINVQEKRAAENATAAWGEHVEELKRKLPTIANAFRDTLSAVPNLIISAFTGGGDALQATLSTLGSKLGTALFSKIAGSASGLLGNLGAKFGGAIFDMIPGIGGAVGALIGPVFDKIFKTEGKKVNDLRDDFVAAAGGIAELDAKAHAAGMTLDALLKAKTVKDYEAAVKSLEVGFASYNAELARTKAIQDEIDALQKQLDENPDWKAMQEAAQKYGVDLAGLGPAFQSARLHESATTIWNDFELLKRGGGDVGVILSGMGDEISALVQDSQAFGVAIPEQFRPLIQELIRSGQLIGANGQAITDMSSIQFGAPIVSEVDKICLKIDELIASLRQSLIPSINDVVPAVGGIGREMNGVDFETFRRRGVEAFEAVEDAAEGAATGHSPGGVREIGTQLGIVAGIADWASGSISGALSGIYGLAMTAAGGVSGLAKAISELPDRLPGYVDEMPGLTPLPGGEGGGGGGGGGTPKPKTLPGLAALLGSFAFKRTDTEKGDLISLKDATEQVQTLWQKFGQGSATQDQLNMLAGAFGVGADQLIGQKDVARFLSSLVSAAMKSGYGPVSMDDGGYGTVTRPTLFLAGAHAPEDYAFSGEGRRFARNGGGPVTITVPVSIDGREVTRVVARWLPDVLAAQGVR